MKKSMKYISLIIAAIFLITGTMLIAFADDEPGGAVDNGGNGGVVDNGGNGGAVDNGNSGGAVDNGNSGAVDNGNSGAVDNGNSGAVDNGNSGAVDNGSGYSGGYSDSDSGYDYGNYSDNGQVYYDSDPIVYGDSNSNYANINNEEAAGSVSSNTTLYNSSGMSAQEAAPNEWSDITLDEKKVSTGGSSDFSSIKTNTETTDNGYWILYLGYILLGLSALGILYFIIATIVYRSANKKAERMERRRGSSQYASDWEDNRNYREPIEQRPRTSRYADESYSSRRRVSSRADTDEVYIPRRTRAK